MAFPVEAIAAAVGVLSAAGGAGGAYGAVRTRLRRAETDVDELETKISEHAKADTEQHTEIVQRLTKIETILERIEQKV